MKAIVVKVLAPTNTQGKRFRVEAEGVKALVISEGAADKLRATTLTRHGAIEQSPELAAAYELCRIYEWTGRLHEGALPNGDKVFVFAND